LAGLDIAAWLHEISLWALPVLLAITLHEAAHGFVAWRLGDDTAYRQGRVSLNPLRHVDPFGTIVLPALLLLTTGRILFGYAKPVPVHFGRLRNPRSGMVLVAAAGPATNLALALASAALIHLVPILPEAAREWAWRTLAISINLNVVLAVFNLLPLPPLDGGRVAVGLLPRSLARPLARVEPYGMIIVLAALVLPALLGPRLGVDLDILYWLVGVPARAVMEVIVQVTGLP
jgi:Zn-dependent protease